MEIALSAGMDSAEFVQYYILPEIAQGQEAQIKVEDHRGEMSNAPAPVISAASVRTAQGYDIETLISWKSLNIRPETGNVFGFRLSVLDVDDPLPGPGLRYSKDYVSLYSPSGSAFDSKKVFGLRLAERVAAATPPRCSYRHNRAWFPRVIVCGVGAAPGEIIHVTDVDGQVLAKGGFEEIDGLYVAEIKLPYPKPGEAIAHVKVLMDGREIDAAAFPYDGKKPAFGFYLPEKVGANEQAGFRLDMLQYGGDALGAGPVKIDLLDSNGKLMAQFEKWLGEEVRLDLPKGLYYLRSQFDYYGLPYMVEGGVCVGDRPREEIAKLLLTARATTSDAKYADYAGMIEFLAYQVEESASAETAPSERTLTDAARLAQWTARIVGYPQSLSKLRGRQEWAYLSKADGTGQPFVIEIPENYDAAKPYPLFVFLHGSMSIHTEGFDLPMKPDEFRLYPLGRAVSAGFESLCEVDVIEAIDYVKSHWSIDANRVHLSGASMGGGGAFLLASRHPDLFASARSISGYGLGAPVKNLLNLPFTMIHGTADWMVPLDEARGAVRKASAAGAPAHMALVEGVGHGMPHESASEQNAREESARHKRVERPRRVHYTATDESARGAYWISVEEWGPEGRPAITDALLNEENNLHLLLDNVKSVQINLAASPADQGKKLTVIVNNQPLSTLPAPLPETIHVSWAENSWTTAAEAPSPFHKRLHFPGGARALYHGEPLMVVWGTQGDAAMNAAILRAAEVARRSPNPNWPTEKKGKERFLGYMLSGRLPGKPDTEVTDENMARYNLLLLGTAAQNSVAARIASALPVSIEGDKAISTDGCSWAFKGRAIGLLYFNPLAPKRLIYWAASDVPEFYRPETPLMEMAAKTAFSSPDFILADAVKMQAVAARRFDSRWNWEAGYANSPKLKLWVCDKSGYMAAGVEAIRREAGAHFGIGAFPEEWTADRIWVPEESRVMDAAAMEFSDHVSLMEMSGRELLEFQEAFSRDTKKRFVIVPALDRPQPDRLYRVAMGTWTVWPLAERFHKNFDSFRLIDATVRDALLNHLE